MRYKILSLIDITKHSNNRRNQDPKLSAQFSNYMTFENCIMLRSNIQSLSTPPSEVMDITNLKFGENYSGEHRVWSVLYEPEFPDAVNTQTLQSDFDLVPMLLGLDETANIKTGAFRTKDEDYTNILFIKQIDN